MYDQFGEEGLKNGGMPPPGAGGMGGGMPGGMPGGFQYTSRSAEDIFSEVRSELATTAVGNKLVSPLCACKQVMTCHA